MVDGSNECLYYPDKDLDPNLWKGLPLQKSFEKVDVGISVGFQACCTMHVLASTISKHLH